ncbi:hypothetical protein SUGI_1128770 [Cryptomeria japonica]|nr:hypothetical protein SUGI_1128770 [Cryptomeria japonica]
MSFTIGQHSQRLPNIPMAKDLIVLLPRFPSLFVHFRTFEAHKESKGLTFMNCLSISVEESWAMLSNTCQELEGKFVDYFERSTGQFMFPMGISMPSLPPRPDVDHWLACEIPFLCVLFIDAGAELHRVSEDCTPSRGLVVTEWAPQLHILNHPSTGAFLSHYGWNSVTEGLRFGVPIVSLPIQFNQPLVARLMADELKMGVEVKRNEEDGSFTKEDVAKDVKL